MATATDAQAAVITCDLCLRPSAEIPDALLPVGPRRRVHGVICPDFSLDLTGLFPGKHLNQFLANKMQDFRKKFLHNCILNFDSGHVYLKLQVTNVKNKEVTAHPKPQTLNPKPQTLNPGPSA